MKHGGTGGANERMPKLEAIAGDRYALTPCDKCGEYILHQGTVTLHATGSHKVVWKASCSKCVGKDEDEK